MANNPGNSSNAIAGALTYPASSSNHDQELRPLPVQPRQPRNLQGLLRFAMEATKAEDAPGTSELGPLDEQRRKFLEDALRNLTVNVTEVMQNAIKVLTNKERLQNLKQGEALPDDVENAFTVLLNYIDDMDIANDFYKLGGFAVFPICYGGHNEKLRSMASTVLAELCQNNPYCQAKALECGLINVLLNLVQMEKGEALVKCVYAISCATREFEPACRDLLNQGGCYIFAELLKEPEPSVRTKAAFFVRYICQHLQDGKEQFINKLHIVKIIAEQLKTGRDESSEHLLSILIALVNTLNPIVFQQCRDPDLNLKTILEDHLKHPELQDDTYREEKEYTQELLLKLFNRCPLVDPVDEVADR